MAAPIPSIKEDEDRLKQESALAWEKFTEMFKKDGHPPGPLPDKIELLHPSTSYARAVDVILEREATTLKPSSTSHKKKTPGNK